MVTIKDVAAAAGVSVATVSRALNNQATVDADLADRVRVAAAELGYRRNGVARSLRLQRTDVWALIISDIANPFFTAVARGLEDVAQEQGYSVVLCNSDEDPAKEARYLDVAVREQVSGVVLSPNEVSSDISHLQRLGVPVVAIDRPLREPVDSVLVRSAAGAEEATAHLLEQGWRRPACITGPESAGTAVQRLTGYRRAMAAHSSRPPKNLVRYADYRADRAGEAAADLLDGRYPPDAFFVANSEMALGVLEELRHRQLLPGRDVGLVAFDDAPWTPFTERPLTVVAQPAYEMGVLAGRLLLDRIGVPLDAQPPARTRRLRTELVVRGSSLRG
ncbi:LacI family DNA-binding transcriptional regulator [Flexivirga sp. ID2601S]|uniref:LacI family DNA-binding transcriptional regulator n=1 Tax=Flexivirga aerilata TaxID=1656889 RepID=A0A849AJ65_9MICO|nr:LacI family DNA-binding transcriptional regulator [Flexivirga aerilata]